MSKPAVADTEPFAFRQELQETIFETIKGWEVRLPGKPLRGTTGADADLIADAVRETYVEGLRSTGSAGQHYLAMRGEVVQAHNELDRVSIERSEEGAIHSLPHRVAVLAGRYLDEQRRRIDCERRLVFEAIMRDRVFRTVGAPAATTALRLADAIEDGLLESGRDEATFVAGQRWGKTEAMREKIREGDEEEEFKAGVELPRGLARFRNVIRHWLGL